MREHRGRWGSDFGAIQSWAINNIESLATEAGIKEVVFDRGAYRFHGRVKALAAAAREAGLSF